MQISRHWRLNPERYRMQSNGYTRGKERAFGSGYQEIEVASKREVGAMLLFYTDANCVWLMEDEAKKEQVVGLFTGNFETSKRYNTVAGCQEGKETVIGSLLSEFVEEMYPGCSSQQAAEIKRYMARFSFESLLESYLIVNQIKNTGHLAEMNRIGVRVLGINVSASSDLGQILSEKGIWMDVDKIVKEYKYITNGPLSQGTNGYTNFRPQMIFAVTAWRKNFSKAKISKLNQMTINTGKDLAEELHLKINPGVIGDDGTILPATSYDTRDYLGVV
jgi:hypothetical protein